MNNKLKIIETANYILAVSDEEIKEAMYVYSFALNTVERNNDFNNGLLQAKIIAYSTKNNAPELDLPLLPEIVVKDNVDKLIKEFKYFAANCQNESLNLLCNKSWQMLTEFKMNSKVYSEEDLKKAIEIASGERLIDRENQVSKIIQSLKKTKIPTWFIAEVEYQNLEGKWNSYYPFASSAKDERLKTKSVNDKTYLVGTYIYE